MSSKEQKRLGVEKFFANRGVRRNKKPLRNIEYRIELVVYDAEIHSHVIENTSKQYLYKDKEHLMLLYWRYQTKYRNMWNWHGFMTKEELKKRLTQKQYSDFCQGKRFNFIRQRRVDGRNV